jgi:ribonuclease Z
MIQLIFLGTGGTIPTERRSLPATVISFGGEILLFDCGEGTQRRYLQAGLRLNRPMKIFITHLHGDHILGLPGLLLTFSLLGRSAPLEIYGPSGISAFIKAMIRTVKFHLSFTLSLKETHKGTVVTNKAYRIEAASANHSVPCYSYAFVEADRSGKFHPNKAIALGLKPGPAFRALQTGSNVKVGRRVVKPLQVMDAPRPGAKIVLSGDTYYSKNLVRLASGAEVLVHECTFDDSLKEKAAMDKHSTPAIACRVAKEAHVRRLILNHVTQRYPEPEILLQQAVPRFSKTLVSEDLMKITVNATN